ncbi:MAG: PTS system mannose/fructose/sorbose family transporter subunit IID [Lactobacillus sp.]|jgi:mannose/fructose/N-acetylgalactosamine-specific phosphotransferase system component IID|nr:PTS system mannose/fructose/sorbose family transporter subunit IID [Lactobacillus sp.]MCI2032344.1 PTS system mannose/fructose/sorbose family transporter subunit IID [Lactobacillus sp.]
MVDEAKTKTPKRLTKKELRSIFLRYGIMTESAMSYEKMHGATWAYSYMPVGEKYYKDNPEAYKRLLTRHAVFYNTEPQTGQLVNGIVASLEEQIGMGNKEIDENVPVTVKASLMGPLAGIGDSVMQGILIPTLLSIAMGLSKGGSALGPVFYIVAYAVIATAITIIAFRSGYKLGVSAIDKLIGESAKRITNMFTVLGMIVIGGLSASTIAVTTTVKIPFGDKTKGLQEILDGFFPGLLPLILVLFTWWLISSKHYGPTKVILILTAVAAIGVLIGFL